MLVRATAELDLVIARGTLSRGWRGALVTPSRDVVLRGARHPLLERASAVPIDLELGSLRALVISGPNTGGKTVALKTLGLAAALYQSGLRPPADEAALPVFDEILVDIGDEQSIAMSLSTFSAHLRNLVGILERATRRVARAPRRDRRRHRPRRGCSSRRGAPRPPRDAGAAHRDDEPLRGAEGMGERGRRRRQRRHRDRSGDERAALHGDARPARDLPRAADGRAARAARADRRGRARPHRAGAVAGRRARGRGRGSRARGARASRDAPPTSGGRRKRLASRRSAPPRVSRTRSSRCDRRRRPSGNAR